MSPASGAMRFSPTVLADGRALSADWLQRLASLRIDLELGLVGRLTMRFHDLGYAISSSETLRLGKEVTVKLRDTDLFTGTVASLNLEQVAGQAPELVVTVDDVAAKLAGNTGSRAFLNLTYSDVISKIAGGAGLQASVASTSPPHPYLLQTGSDLAFLNAVVARAGMIWRVEGKKLVVEKTSASGGSAQVDLAEELLSFSVRTTAIGPDKVEVTGWNNLEQTGVKGAGTHNVQDESDFVSRSPGRSQAKSRGRKGDTLVADPAPLDAKEAAALASAKLADAQSSAVVATGTCQVNPALKPSVALKVTNAGPTSGTYRLTRVEHIYGSSGFTTRFTAGGNRPAALVDLLDGAPTDPGFAMHGVLPAIVTDLADPEKYGRAKVKFTTLSGDVESAWARIVTLGAGKERGMVFQPEVNDEVLVAFEQGDTRRPVVLGGLFSPKKGLPTSDNVKDNKVNFRRITSRLGYVLEFADGGTDKDHILLQLKDGPKIRLGKDKIEVVNDNKPIAITNGKASIEFSASGDIKIKGQKVSIEAGLDLTLSAKTEIKAKGDTGVKVEGLTVELKGNTMAKVESSAMVAIKGMPVAIN